MEFLAITFVNIIWLAYSLSEGIRESFFDYFKSLNKRNCLFKVKKIFLIQRVLVLLLIALSMSFILGFSVIPIAIGQLCMFKYFHKISYDLTSKKLCSDSIEKIEEFSISRKMSEHKKSLLFFGIALQIFIYIFVI